MSKRKTTEGFIERATIKHKGKYSYEKAIYQSWDKKVCITCHEHGDFWQTPNSHLNGRGCPTCGRMNQIKSCCFTTEDFIKRATDVHNDKYDYSLVEYTNARNKVKIICKIHGIFEQEAFHHLNGGSCPKCKNKNVTKEDFINKAKSVHGLKYDYSNVIYRGSKINIDIVCPKHGIFKQTPCNHLKGQRCPKCIHEETGRRCRLSTTDFVNKAKLVHGEKYDYSATLYTKQTEPVTIICPKHGAFLQLPSNHLNGEGCPKCNVSHGEDMIKKILERNNISFKWQYRIQNENLFCKNKKLIVDFYLQDYNLFIEFNGVQHYKPNKRFGGIKSFNRQQERDYALKQYCKDHNIKLLIISYKQINDIVSILNKSIRGELK